MVIKNPSKSDLESRLKKARVDKIDDKEYMTESELAKVLGLVLTTIGHYKHEKRFASILKPKLTFGLTNLYTKAQARAVYEARYLI